MEDCEFDSYIGLITLTLLLVTRIKYAVILIRVHNGKYMEWDCILWNIYRFGYGTTSPPTLLWQHNISSVAERNTWIL